MAVFRASPKKCHFYSPDGTNNPLTFILPGYCVDGEPVRFVNLMDSSTPITLTCEEEETIEVTYGVFVKEMTLSGPNIRAEFIKHRRKWYRWM